jgi:uncharacterized protein (TIGR02217 family)
MPAQILDDVIFPSDILSVSARGRKRWATSIVANQGGFEARNSIRTQPKREYEIGLVPRRVSDWASIDKFHDIVQGALYGFLLRDPVNNAATVADGLMRPLPAALTGTVGTTGVGYGVPYYRLLKRATVGARTHDRDVRKPQTGAVTLYRAGSPVTLGVSAGNAAIDTVNGNVAFVADTSEAITSITIGASTVLNFSGGAGIVAAMSVAQRVYVSGVTGTAAATLNSLSHAISAKGATSLTISTSTAGLAVTLPGTAAKYPQASETLTWAGSFYVPVRFAEDDIDWQLVGGHSSTDSRLIEGPSVLLIEELIP